LGFGNYKTLNGINEQGFTQDEKSFSSTDVQKAPTTTQNAGENSIEYCHLKVATLQKNGRSYS